MNRLFLAATIIVISFVPAAFSGTTVGGSQQAVTIPDTLASSVPNGKPVWVAADVASDRAGHFRSEYFDDYVITMLDSFRASEREQEQKAGTTNCVGTLSSTSQEHTIADDTADDLVKNAYAILRGQVVGAREGFYFGQPGMLLAVQVTSSLKRMGPIANASIIYTFVERARIDTPLGPLCANGFDAGVIVPQIGDRLLLFALYDPADATHTVIPIDVRRSVVIERGRKLRMPKALQHLPARNLDDVTSAVKANPRIQDLPTRWRKLNESHSLAEQPPDSIGPPNDRARIAPVPRRVNHREKHRA